MLTDMYLYPLLSGQVVDMAAGTLQLTPKFPPPYVLPVLISGVEASLARAVKGGPYTLKVAFGELELKAGGLVVDGVPCAKPVKLGEGESITCG